LIVAVATFGGLAARAGIAQNPELPEAPGKAQTLTACTQCHGVDVLLAQRRTHDEWLEVVSRMVGNGASLTDQEYEAVVSYLSKNLARAEGPAAPVTH